MEIIGTVKDPRVMLARELNSRVGRKKHFKFLIEGEENLKSAVDSGINVNYILCVKEEYEKYSAFKSFIPSFVATTGIMKKITESKHLIPVIAVADTPIPGDSTKEFILIMDQVKDFNKAGSIIRTGRSFGIDDYFAVDSYFDPFDKKAIEASSGLVFSCDFRLFPDDEHLIENIKKKGYQIITNSPNGESLESLVEFSDKPVALVIGSEPESATDKYINAADRVIQIPIRTDAGYSRAGVKDRVDVFELKIKQILNFFELKIRSSLDRQVHVLDQLIKKVFDEKLKKITNIGAARIRFLMALHCEKVMRITDIIRNNGLLDSEVDSFLAPLLRDELIMRKEEGIVILPKAEDILSALWTLRDLTESDILSVLTEAEYDFFNDISKRLIKKCENILKDESG